METEKVMAIVAICAIVCFFGWWLWQIQQKEAKDSEKKLKGEDMVTYYQLYYGQNWSFFKPSFGMAKMKITKKRGRLGKVYQYETIWEVGPIKSEYGKPWIVRALIEKIAQVRVV